MILVVVLSESVKGQSDSTYLKHSIKTNVFQWFMNEPNVIYEHRFNRKFGLETTLGTYGINNRDIFFPFDHYEPLPQKGITLRVNPKWYIGSKSLKKSLFYFSPMLLLKNSVAVGYWNSLSYSARMKEKRFIVGGSALIGYQSVIARRLIFDFYLGGGLRYRDINRIYLDHPTGEGSSESFFNEPGWRPSLHAGIKLGFGFKRIN